MIDFLSLVKDHTEQTGHSPMFFKATERRCQVKKRPKPNSRNTEMGKTG